MDRKDRLRYGKYLRTLADKMELRDWTTDIIERPSPDGANACVITYRGKKWASIQLMVGFEQRSPEENRKTLVHELLHCHTGAMTDAMQEAEKECGKTWFKMLGWQITLHEEFTIAALAEIIAPFMPLPPEPKAKKKRKAA